MAREQKFNFQPALSFAKARGKKPFLDSCHATINVKHQMLTLSKTYVEKKGLKDSYVKFYIDPSKKALAWKVLKGETLKRLKDYKRIKQGGSTNTSYQVYIGSPLEVLNLPLESFKKLPIKTYVTTGFLKDGPYDYVIIKKSKHEQESSKKEYTACPGVETRERV
jgi:hypothetical protein